MYSPNYHPRNRSNTPKDPDRNFVAAFFHMATIALTCVSLAQLGWFRLKGGQCAPHLAVYQFFSLGYFNKISRPMEFSFSKNQLTTLPVPVQYFSSTGLLECVTPKVANLMRILILLCFMAMISSLIGFILDIIGPTSHLYKSLRRNSVPSIITVLWITAILGVCYYITTVLEVEAKAMNDGVDVQVSYEYGCYTITAAGVAALLATASNLLQSHFRPARGVQHRQLVEDWDGLETFAIGSPRRDMFHENTPPPPYTP